MKMFWQRKCKSYSSQSVNERWKMWMCIRFVFPVCCCCCCCCSSSVLFFLSVLAGLVYCTMVVVHGEHTICEYINWHWWLVYACVGWCHFSLSFGLVEILLFLSCKRVHRCVIVHFTARRQFNRCCQIDDKANATHGLQLSWIKHYFKWKIREWFKKKRKHIKHRNYGTQVRSEKWEQFHLNANRFFVLDAHNQNQSV